MPKSGRSKTQGKGDFRTSLSLFRVLFLYFLTTKNNCAPLCTPLRFRYQQYSTDQFYILALLNQFILQLVQIIILFYPNFKIRPMVQNIKCSLFYFKPCFPWNMEFSNSNDSYFLSRVDSNFKCRRSFVFDHRI